MYYRRKIILALLEAFGNNLSNIFFQKILFLFCHLQNNPVYDFVPYKFGPFSFLSYKDRRAMIKYGLLVNNNSWKKNISSNYLSNIKKEDENIVNNLKNKFFDYSNQDLIEYVYKNYPEYTVNSELTSKYIKRENKIAKDNQEIILYTIGYQGITIDLYLRKLLNNNIHLLCDVRKNPISMKYGFSKTELKRLLKKINIEYIHFPELGIESSKRKNLKTQNDYNELFIDYKNNYLPKKEQFLNELNESLKKYKRIAITCFESDYKSCHRNKVTEALSNKKDWDYPIIHL